MDRKVQKVLDNCVQIPWTGCMIWMGSLCPQGYARGGPDGKSVGMHRWLYKKLVGDPGELTLDHLCRVRCCINPDHMEPCDIWENTSRGFAPPAINARKDICLNGHDYDKRVYRASGAVYRRCTQCRKDKWRAKNPLPDGDNKKYHKSCHTCGRLIKRHLFVAIDHPTKKHAYCEECMPLPPLKDGAQ